MFLPKALWWNFDDFISNEAETIREKQMIDGVLGGGGGGGKVGLIFWQSRDIRTLIIPSW
jgi:hypothetical protein